MPALTVDLIDSSKSTLNASVCLRLSPDLLS